MTTKRTLNLTISTKSNNEKLKDQMNDLYDQTSEQSDEEEDDNMSSSSLNMSITNVLIESSNKNIKPMGDMMNERNKIKEKFIELLGEKGTECETLMYIRVKEITKSDMGDNKFRREYLATGYNLLENLNITGYVGNTYLFPKVMDGTISLKQLVAMTDEELYPPKWKILKDKRLKEIKNENNQKVATTDLYKCNKCHKRECTYFQLQTRSQDEPMTTFITCNNCGTRWKE